MGDDTLRDSLESAFDVHEQPEAGQQPATNTPKPAAPAVEAPEAGQPPAETSGRARDQSGRFAKREAAAQPAKPAAVVAGAGGKPATAGAAPDGQLPVDRYAKAPQSWRPGARENWASLSPEIREEIYRREREVTRSAQEHAQARDVATYVQRLQQQFAPALQAEGVDALTASANLMQMASRLRFGTPVEKAQIAAHIIRTYGVDIMGLAQVLDGTQQPRQQQAPQYQDPRVDQLLAQLQGVQQQRDSQLRAQAEGNVESFGSSHEFFEDVRHDMGDIMELAAKRGVDMTLEQAYQRACSVHPEISKVLAAREGAGRAGNGSRPSIQQSKAAASSVRGTPAVASTSPPSDLRGAIEAAIEQVGGR